MNNLLPYVAIYLAKCQVVCYIGSYLDLLVIACALASRGIVAFRNMKNQPATIPFIVAIATSIMLDSYKLRLSKIRTCGGLRSILPAVVALATLLLPAAIAQQASPKYSGGVTIQGTVLGLDGKPVSDAVVSLEKKDSSSTVETKTNAAGAFVFSSLSSGSYRISGGKLGWRSPTPAVIAASDNTTEKADLVLQGSGLAPDFGISSAPGAQAMEFA